ncbi:MAG: KamA family radical SAM protein [Candidatus Abyssubacteria bacterium]|nr:KamA family radical SAM protein [Candidatus Abyssubacteria bacterium]
MGWKSKLKENITSIEDLKKYVKLTAHEEHLLQKVIEIHPMSISRYYMSLIDKRDKKDPLRKMIIPSIDELNIAGTYDTSGEQKSTKAHGLQHKYGETALILATNRCAAYCRFCFRKRLVGLPNEEILRRFNDALPYIRSHKEINNVLISGGDPFTLPTEIVENFLKQLTAIKHLDFIRFGTRVPVTFPDRILDDKSLTATLKRYTTKDKRLYIVTHFNHPNEITEKSIDAIDRLISANLIVNNQTVLMKGVNDNPDVLAKLMKKLVSIGVNPYYVFQCRPVKRVKSHFQVPFARGVRVVEGAKKQLDGHSKRFKFCMSHDSGKIEIVGVIGDKIYLRHNQARYAKDRSRFFVRKLDNKAAWLDDLQ